MAKKRIKTDLLLQISLDLYAKVGMSANPHTILPQYSRILHEFFVALICGNSPRSQIQKPLAHLIKI